MGMVIEETDEGTKPLVAAELQRIPDQITEETKAKLDAIWDKIYEAALMLCPVDTGTLLSTIRIVSSGEIGGLGGGEDSPEGGAGEKAITIYDSTIIAGDESVRNEKTGEPCIYAEWVHDGHFCRGERWVEGVPFLEMAIDMYAEELDEALDEVMDVVGGESGGGGAE
jgi:hypothetical protein